MPRLKVMISSTLLDLPAHRKAAEDAVLRAGCVPLMMEHGTATSDSNAIQFSLALLDQADLYIGIFAQRYGFIPKNRKDNPKGWSVTEHEYRRAKKRGIPRLIYLADKDHKFSADDFDFDPDKRVKLDVFKEELRTKEICGLFSTSDKLHSLILQSLFEETAKYGHVGAAEPQPLATVPHPPEIYTVPAYTLTNEFFGRRAELAALDVWAASPDPIMVVEAIGGMGKSALTWEWTLKHSQRHISGLAGRVWWSFYERGTSMRTFLRHALAYITRQDPEVLRKLDTYDCGQQLLVELRRKPYLLVLDGFERVLTAYHRLDKAQIQDHDVPIDKRECTNPKDGDILRQLVHCGPSKVLVSSRLMPRVLEDRHTHQQIPGVRRLELAGLTPGDALDLVRSSGVHGDPAAILYFVDQFDRHALVLRIVCGMIADYRPKPGDFNVWKADPCAGGKLKLNELPLKQRYTHILDFAFRGLGKKTRQLLSRIAVLSDGADYATIAVLNPFLPAKPKGLQEPDGLLWAEYKRLRGMDMESKSSLEKAIGQTEEVPVQEKKKINSMLLERQHLYRDLMSKMAEYDKQKEKYTQRMRRYLVSAKYHKALADFHAALRDLEDRGLLQWDRDTNTYDLHPVVRAYAFEKLEERDRAGTYNAVRDHFSSLPPERVAKATELAQVKNSIEIMRALIGAGRLDEALSFYKGDLGQSLMFSIGAYHIVIELLEPLLSCNRDGAFILSELDSRNYVVNAVAGALFYLGRLDEAAEFCHMVLRRDVESGNCASIASSLRNFGSLMRDMNRLAAAAQAFQLAYDTLDAVNYTHELTSSILSLGADACIRGEFERAEMYLSSFQQREQPGFVRYRPGDAEQWLAQLRFRQGSLTTKDLDHADSVSSEGRNLFGKQRLAALRAEWELARGNPATALEAIEQALAIGRRTGAPAPSFMGLRALALARLACSCEAREALAEAEELWNGLTPRFPLAAAETWLVLGDRELARKYVRRAYPLAWADGPPYIHWHELKRCREVMAELGEPEPQLPPFNPNKGEAIPYETEIRAVIKSKCIL